MIFLRYTQNKKSESKKRRLFHTWRESAPDSELGQLLFNNIPIEKNLVVPGQCKHWTPDTRTEDLYGGGNGMVHISWFMSSFLTLLHFPPQIKKCM